MVQPHQPVLPRVALQTVNESINSILLKSKQYNTNTRGTWSGIIIYIHEAKSSTSMSEKNSIQKRDTRQNRSSISQLKSLIIYYRELTTSSKVFNSLAQSRQTPLLQFIFLLKLGEPCHHIKLFGLQFIVFAASSMKR